MPKPDQNSSQKPEIEHVINDVPLSMKEAKSHCLKELNIGDTYFYRFIRSKLNLRPLILDVETEKVGKMAVLQSEVDEVIYQIKKEFKERG
jgi:hypothetical protein